MLLSCDIRWLCFVLLLLFYLKVKEEKVKKGTAVLEWPRGFQEVEVPRFHDNGTRW
jgi:hypothetical protein